LSQNHSGIRKLLRDVVAIATSRKRLRQQLSIPLYQNAIYLVVNYVVTGAFGLAFWVVAARLYPPEDVGLASATISAMLLVQLFAALGLDYAIVRFLPEAGKDSNAMINSSLTMVGLAAALISALFLIGLSFWSPALLYLHHPARAVAFIVLSVAWTVAVLQSRTFVARRRSGLTLAQGTLANVLRMALLVPFTAAIGVFGMPSSWGIAVLVSFVIGVLVLQPRVEAGFRFKPAIDWSLVRRFFGFSAANYAAVLLWTAPVHLLPLMVANLVGTDYNAYFQIAWSVSSVMYQIPMGVSFSLLAEASTDKDRLNQGTRRSLVFTSLIVIPAVVLAIVFARPILGIFKSEYVSHSTNLLRILALAAVPLSINQLFFVSERVRMTMRRLIALHVLICGSTLAISAILLPRVGIIGAGIAWLSSQSAASLVAAFFWWRERGGRRPQPTVTD
jgi:O-antigen/teichoic acid export membrane protein